MTERSPRFALPFLLPGQAQKEVFHNEALIALDCALHPCVEGAPQTEPPANPQVGQGWIVGEGASGGWEGRTNALASWTAGGWRFTAPVPGMTVWNKVFAYRMHWTGSAWADGVVPASALVIGGNQVVGSRLPSIPSPSGGTTIDEQARTAVASLIATLKSHGLID